MTKKFLGSLIATIALAAFAGPASATCYTSHGCGHTPPPSTMTMSANGVPVLAETAGPQTCGRSIRSSMARSAVASATPAGPMSETVRATPASRIVRMIGASPALAATLARKGAIAKIGLSRSGPVRRFLSGR